jgi:integrase
MTVSELIAAFMADRQLRGAAPETLTFYRCRLKTLETLCGSRAADSLTVADCQAVLAAGELGARGKPVSQSTRHHNANALGILQAWAVDSDLIPKLWAKKLPKPGVASRERLPTEAETRAILKGARADFVRIFHALRRSGARPGELCRARIEDLRSDGRGRWIELAKHKTAAKTGKPRIIPIGSKLGAMIDRAVGARTSGPIFLRRTRPGKPLSGWTPETLSAMYRRRRDAAGLPADLCLYLTRHEAGTRIVKTSGVEQAARCLGHAPGSRVTSRYVHLDVAYLGDCQDSGE